MAAVMCARVACPALSRLLPALAITATLLLNLAIVPAKARPELPGLGACALSDPGDLAVSAQGDVLYIADTGNSRILAVSQGFGCDAFVIEADGAQQALDAPQGVAIDSSGRIYIADTGNDRILLFEAIGANAPGTALDDLGFSTQGATAPDGPGGLGVDESGRLYVADTGNARVLRFPAGGGAAAVIGTPAGDPDEPALGELVEPSDVAVCPASAADASAGRVYVADRGTDKITVFEPDGDVVFRFGVSGGGPGQLLRPEGIAVDQRCNVYVADNGNARTQMFSGAGDFLEVMSTTFDAAGIAVSGFLGQGGVSGGVFVSSGADATITRLEYIDYDTDGDGLIDSDGDALPDLWEEQGIDIGFDGEVDYVLPGADPRRKQVYLEMDFMAGQALVPALQYPGAVDALDVVVNAFAAAPVGNPDGSTGIDLIVERGDTAPLPGDPVAFDVDAETLAMFPASGFFFDNLKRALFGTAAERAAAGEVLEAKALAYRYALMVGSICGSGAIQNGQPVCTAPAPVAGQAELPGDDFVFRRGPITNPAREATVIMHELGHTLGLEHGGHQAINCKPNYLSVMNYVFGRGIPNDDPALPDGYRIDYSARALDTLDESDLDEPAGIGLDPVGENGIFTDYTSWSDPNVVRDFGRGDRPLDWNGNGAIEPSVAVDINNDAASDLCSGTGTVLEGWNDWNHLHYSSRESGNFGRASRDAVTENEPSHADLDAIEAAWDAFRAPRYSYAAKFICVPEVGPEAGALSPGRYRTVVNVHNPHGDALRFRKKAVIARVEGEPRGPISAWDSDELGPDDALSITCASIAARFDGDVGTGDGFVVIESERLLDVSAVYTARDSVDVEAVAPTDRDAGAETPPDDEGDPGQPGDRERVDLTVELPERTRVRCPAGPQSCLHVVTVRVRNLAAVAVNDPIAITVTTNAGTSTTTSLPGLQPNGLSQFQLSFGPGPSCFTPDCTTEATVDPDDAIPETDETNNTATREDAG